MIVVSDTTPIISLLKVGQLDILQRLYGEIAVPEAVYTELTFNEAFPEEAAAVAACSFIRREAVRNAFAAKILAIDMNLDKGESEALVLAEDLHADLLLVDERKARAVAKQLGIAIVGTLGMLLEAKRRGFISQLSPLLDTLQASNIRLSSVLIEEILKLESELGI